MKKKVNSCSLVSSKNSVILEVISMTSMKTNMIPANNALGTLSVQGPILNRDAYIGHVNSCFLFQNLYCLLHGWPLSVLHQPTLTMTASVTFFINLREDL